MSKKLAITLIVVAVLVGAVAGIQLVSRFVWGPMVNELVCSSAAASAGMNIHALKHLRAGNLTNAAELLEIRLDSSLMTLGFYLSETPKSHQDTNQWKILRMAKEYRTEFPHTNRDASLQKDIERALSSVNEDTKH